MESGDNDRARGATVAEATAREETHAACLLQTAWTHRTQTRRNTGADQALERTACCMILH